MSGKRKDRTDLILAKKTEVLESMDQGLWRQLSLEPRLTGYPRTGKALFLPFQDKLLMLQHAVKDIGVANSDRVVPGSALVKTGKMVK